MTPSKMKNMTATLMLLGEILSTPAQAGYVTFSGIGLAALSAVSIFVSPALAVDQTRVKIASSSHRENGCSESYKSFKVVIPNPERLDRDYKGVLGGIERVYVEANGTRRDGDYALTDNGSALTFTLFAKGGGTRISNPFNRGSWCQGASGASITIDIYAHYKAAGL